jgi:hypothetical protein
MNWEMQGKKKRLGLCSPRRLGSPPPELPNHEMDIREALIECSSEAVLNWNAAMEENAKTGRRCCRLKWGPFGRLRAGSSTAVVLRFTMHNLRSG